MEETGEVTRFQIKAGEFSRNKNYNISSGKAYEILTIISILHGATHLKERIFHEDIFYKNVYKITEEKIRLEHPSKLQQSNLENISNEAYKNYRNF